MAGELRGLDGGALVNTGADGERSISPSDNERVLRVAESVGEALPKAILEGSVELIVTERRRGDLGFGATAISFNGDRASFLTRSSDLGLVDSLERGDDCGEVLFDLGDVGDVMLDGLSDGKSLILTFITAALAEKIRCSTVTEETRMVFGVKVARPALRTSRSLLISSVFTRVRT